MSGVDKLGGRDLYGFLQFSRVTVTGIDPNILHGAAFNIEALKAKLPSGGGAEMAFPPEISRDQIKDVFSSPGLSDVVAVNRQKFEVKLLPLLSLGSQVLGEKNLIEGILVTHRVANVLSRTSLMVIGRDAEVSVFHRLERIRQLVSAEPFVLGTDFVFSDMERVFPPGRDPADLIFLLTHYPSQIRGNRQVLVKLAELFPNGMDGKKAAQIGTVPAILTEVDLIIFLKEMFYLRHFDGIAFVDAAIEKPSVKLAVAISELYREIGKFEAAADVLSRAPQDKIIRRIAKQVNKESREELKAMVTGPFDRFIKGEIDARQFLDQMPRNYKGILFARVMNNLGPGVYRAVRRNVEKAAVFSELLDMIVEAVYKKVVEGSLIPGGAQDKVLDLILSDQELDFIPPSEWMRVFERKAHRKKTTYPPAKAIFDRFFYNDRRKARQAAKTRDFAAAWKHYKEANKNYPEQEALRAEISHFFFNWGRHLRQEGKHEEGEENLIMALEFDRDNLSALGMLAYHYAQKGEMAKALMMSERFLKLSPKNAQNLNILGSAYYEKFREEGNPSDLEAGIGYLIESERLEPYSPQVLFNLSLVYIEKGDLPRAIVYCERRFAIDRELDPISGFFRSMLTSRKFMEFDGEELKSAVERFDFNGQDHKKMAVFIHVASNLRSKGFEKAADALLMKLDEAGFPEIAAFARGLDHYRAGRMEEAIPFIAAVVKSEWSPRIHNDYIGEMIPLAEDARNLYLAILGKLDPARAIVEGEGMLDEKSSPVLVNTVGHLNETAGNRERALELYRKAADLNPLFLLPLLNRLILCRAAGDMGGYERILGEIIDRVKKAVAVGKKEQFEYSDPYLILFEEKEAIEHPQLEELLLLLKSSFPENYEIVLQKHKEGSA